MRNVFFLQVGGIRFQNSAYRLSFLSYRPAQFFY